MNQKEKIEWRRNKVQQLLVMGYNHYEIADILKIPRPTITKDILYLSQQSKENIKTYMDERLPEEYDKCLTGITAILKEAWNTSYHSNDNREKIQALSLAKDCYSMKLDLLTNVTVVEDAMRFVLEYNNKNNNNIKIKRNGKEVIDNNSELPHDDDDTVTTNNITTNKVF